MTDFSQKLAVSALSVALTAALSWYATLPDPAILAYSVSTATTGGDSTTRAVVPNLTVRLGDEILPAIHVHTVTLTPQGGYASDASIGITFPTKVRVFGVQKDAPSALHSIDCENIPEGVRCRLAPSDPRHTLPYRVTLATDQLTPPTVITTHTNVEVQSIEAALSERWFDQATLLRLALVTMLIAGAILGPILGRISARLQYMKQDVAEIDALRRDIRALQIKIEEEVRAEDSTGQRRSK